MHKQKLDVKIAIIKTEKKTSSKLKMRFLNVKTYMKS